MSFLVIISDETFDQLYHFPQVGYCILYQQGKTIKQIFKWHHLETDYKIIKYLSLSRKPNNDIIVIK